MLKSHASGTLRAVACLEAAKGSIVLLVGCGLLALIHKNIQHYAERLIPHLHLNPAQGYPHVFLDLAGVIEAYGLWYAKRWAEWFAALSGGIYIPFELHTLAHHVSLLTLGALLVNVVVVAIIASELVRKKNGSSFPEKRCYEPAVGEGKPGPYHDQGSQRNQSGDGLARDTEHLSRMQEAD